MGNPLQLSSQPLAPGLALIFDMDGVMIDSNPVHREAWVAFNLRYGVETTEAMQHYTFGRRNDQIVRHFFGDALPAVEVAARGAAKEALFRDMVVGRLEEVLVPGLREFLERFRGTPMALATNAEPPNVQFLLDSAGLRHYFRVVVDGHQVSHPKPHPEIYLRAAEMLDTAAGNCIVFEDSPSGVEAARAAGTRVVGLSTTYGYLPGTTITVDNFGSGTLTEWLAAQSQIA